MQGQIIKISSDLYFVKAGNETYPCKCRGIFRKEHITPLVGDYVLFHTEDHLIEKVLERKNEFQRPKVSNIDQAFIVTSLVHPDFSTNLLDKMISLMEMHSVKPIIVITKEDLVEDTDYEKIKPILDYYREIGYIVVSNQEIDKIKSLITGKTSVFTGQTGAGKSSLLNKLNPDWNLETGEVSLALGRGKHTTRVVELFDFLDGKVMDTPGFSALDFKDESRENIRNSFIEFEKYPCPYRDCNHTREGECSVKEAVRNGSILSSRYEDYLNFIGEEEII
ncbi:MAG: ribosome small subunit-dependent GTPase A [Bacilli bacterium]|nr:ribosome small subunit-dependent GTPase A [Bacilli bacterium]